MSDGLIILTVTCIAIKRDQLSAVKKPVSLYTRQQSKFGYDYYPAMGYAEGHACDVTVGIPRIRCHHDTAGYSFYKESCSVFELTEPVVPKLHTRHGTDRQTDGQPEANARYISSL